MKKMIKTSFVIPEEPKAWSLKTGINFMIFILMWVLAVDIISPFHFWELSTYIYFVSLFHVWDVLSIELLVVNVCTYSWFYFSWRRYLSTKVSTNIEVFGYREIGQGSKGIRRWSINWCYPQMWYTYLPLL